LLHAAVAVAFSVLVFFFALHAKTAVYGRSSSANITTATASKMLGTTQKLDGRAVQSQTTPVFWLLFVSILSFSLHRRTWLSSAVTLRPANNIPLWQLQRFLRPPPVLG